MLLMLKRRLALFAQKVGDPPQKTVMKLLLSSKLCMSCQFIIKAEKIPLFSIYKDAFSICTFERF